MEMVIMVKMLLKAKYSKNGITKNKNRFKTREDTILFTELEEIGRSTRKNNFKKLNRDHFWMKADKLKNVKLEMGQTYLFEGHFKEVKGKGMKIVNASKFRVYRP